MRPTVKELAEVRTQLEIALAERDSAVIQLQVYEQAMRNIIAAVFASLPKATAKRVISIIEGKVR